MSFEEAGSELSGITVQERHELCKLISLCSVWMRQPIRIDFGEENGKNKSRSNVDGDGMDGEQTVDLSSPERRRARRQRRKNNKLGL